MMIKDGNAPKIWFTDFDGTVKPYNKKVSREDCTALKAIGAQGGIRAVATGRSIRSFERDWEPDFEIDYLISSAGLALSRWGGSGQIEMLESRSFSKEDALLAEKTAQELNIGFILCFPPPRTHAFYYQLPDFAPPPSILAMINSPDREPRQWQGETDFALGQVMLIAEPKLLREKAGLFKQAVPWISYVFTTSPYGDGSLWLEVYPPGVSKGQAAKRLAESLGFTAADALAMGNDYNDTDLLSWAGTSYLSETGPADMLPLYKTMPPAGEAPLKYVLDELCPGVYESYLRG